MQTERDDFKKNELNTSCYCIWFRRAANEMTQFYDRMLEPAGITVNQYSLLVNIERLSCPTVNELAEWIRLERTTLVRSLKPLFERKLICYSSEKKGRSRLLEVTEEGRCVINKARPLWEQAQKRVEEKTGISQVPELKEIIFKLTEGTEEW